MKVILNGHSSRSFCTNAGVSQGCIRGTILFLIFINDLPDGVNSQLDIYVDETTIYSCHDSMFD